MANKNNPKNKREAYCYQLKEDVRVLQSLAVQNDKKGFDQQVDIIMNRLKEIKNVK